MTKGANFTLVKGPTKASLTDLKLKMADITND